MNLKIKGSVKAAYIFSILPGKIKSSVLNELSQNLFRKLNNALKEITVLNISEENSILADFIRNMKMLRSQREAMIDRSITYSISLLLILLLSTFTIALYKYSTVDNMIYFVELILNNGGLHLILAPFLFTYIKSVISKSPLNLLFSSKNYQLDTIIAIVFSLLISSVSLFLLTNEAGISYFKIAKIFTIPLSITIGPAVEELFFRFILFYIPSKRIGYPISAFISSLVFSAIHIPDSYLVFGAYFVIGIILCGLYYYRKSLFPSFMTHALSNLLIQIF